MIKLTKTQTNYELEGVIDETTIFSSCIPDGEITLDCSKITKINSAGVKSWINFFQHRTNITFVHLSVVLVEQMNSLSNFLNKDKVISMAVPFLCTNKTCKKEFVSHLNTNSLSVDNVPDGICPICSSKSEFDDLPEEYFAFLGT